MVGEDAGVEHVGIGDHYVTLAADGLPGVVRGVAVVGVGLDVCLEIADEDVDLVHLILGQGLGGKNIEGPCLRLFKNPLQYREVVAEGLAARRGRHQNDVPAGAHQFHGLALVAVEPPDPPVGEDLPEAGMEPDGEIHIPALPGRDLPERPDIVQEPFILLQPRQPFRQGQLRHRPFSHNIGSYS